MTRIDTDNPNVFRHLVSSLLSATHERLMDESMNSDVPDYVWYIHEDAYSCATRAFETSNYADTLTHLNRFWRI